MVDLLKHIGTSAISDLVLRLITCVDGTDIKQGWVYQSSSSDLGWISSSFVTFGDCLWLNWKIPFKIRLDWRIFNTGPTGLAEREAADPVDHRAAGSFPRPRHPRQRLPPTHRGECLSVASSFSYPSFPLTNRH